MFAALKSRDYRLYWSSGLFSNIGSWVQTATHQWLVLKLTDSAFMLGFVGFVSSLPSVGLSLLGGVLADRLERKRMLMLTQGLFLTYALALGTLTLTGKINIYWICGIAFLSGTTMAFDAPTRQSMVAFLVDRPLISSAVALNSAAFNTARMIGPGLAGMLIPLVGMAPSFYINAASFVPLLCVLGTIRSATSTGNSSSGSVLEDIGAGLRYIKSEPTILKLIIMVAAPCIFVMPYATLLPYIAEHVLHAGARGFGILGSSAGIGAVLGALILARTAQRGGRGRLLLTAAFVNSLALLFFALSRSFWLSAGLLMVVGATVVMYTANTNGLIQDLARDEYRGRVMSAYLFVFMGSAPIANLQAGVVAHYLGVSAPFEIGAVCLFAVALYAAIKMPDIRAL